MPDISGFRECQLKHNSIIVRIARQHVFVLTYFFFFIINVLVYVI